VSIIAQRSFGSGELTPALQTRTDLAKYQTGLATCRNFTVMRQGGVANRPGTEFIVSGVGRARLLPFIFNSEQSYVLLFRDGKVEVMREGVLQIMGRTMDPATLHYSLDTPYSDSDLDCLQIAQSGDTVIIVHPDHQPRTLSRLGAEEWSLTNTVFASVTGPPLADPSSTYLFPDYPLRSSPLWHTGNPSTGTQNKINWVVTAVNALGSESVQSGTAAFDWNGITTPPSEGVVLAFNPVAGAVTYNIYKSVRPYDAGYPPIYGYIGTVNATGNVVQFFSDVGIGGRTPDYSMRPPTPGAVPMETEHPSAIGYFQNRLILAGADATPETVYASETGNYFQFRKPSSIMDTSVIEFTLAAAKVSVIRHVLDVGGLIILTSEGEWVVEGDESGILKPTAINARQVSYNGTSCLPPVVVNRTVLHVHRRQNKVRDITPEGGNDLTIYSSHLFDGYTIRDWSYQATPNPIIWLVRSDGVLLGLTYNREQEFVAWHRHDTDGFVENVCVVPEGEYDSVYIAVRRTSDGVESRYIERMSPRFPEDIHSNFLDSSLFYDGKNTGDGTVTLVDLYDRLPAGSIPSGPGGGGWNGDTEPPNADPPIFKFAAGDDLSGATFARSGDATFVEEYGPLEEDPPLPEIPPLWSPGGTLVLRSSGPLFSASAVGNAVYLYKDGEESVAVRCSIIEYLNSREVIVVVLGSESDVLGHFWYKPTTNWASAVDEVIGLHHLNGNEVGVVADGFVVANPNNPTYEVKTVSGGSLQLNQPYAHIRVGLPYISDIETLDIDSGEGTRSLKDKKTLVNRVGVSVYKSRGIFAGPKAPTGDDPIEGLYEVKVRSDELYNDPVSLATDLLNVNIDASWNSRGRVFIRQVDPLPLTILGVFPQGFIHSGE